MSDYDYGPLRKYRITWRSGQTEIVQGHQVTFGSNRLPTMISAMVDPVASAVLDRLPPRFTIHGQIDGRWILVLTAPEADLLSIRDVTDADPLPWEHDVGPAQDGAS